MSLLHLPVSKLLPAPDYYADFLPWMGSVLLLLLCITSLMHCRQTWFVLCPLISAVPFAVVNVALKLGFIDLYLQDTSIIIQADFLQSLG